MMYRGERRDWIGYQYFNKKTLAIFGEPTFVPEGPVEREVSNPAPKQWPAIDTPPPGAVLVGERLYLRMFTPEDGEIMREASLTDTEFSHNPRFPRSAMTMNSRFRKSSEAELPDNITFAIVLRENDELIGRNELDFLDMVAPLCRNRHRALSPRASRQGIRHRGEASAAELCLRRVEPACGLVDRLGRESSLARGPAETGLPPGRLHPLAGHPPRHTLGRLELRLARLRMARIAARGNLVGATPCGCPCRAKRSSRYAAHSNGHITHDRYES